MKKTKIQQVLKLRELTDEPLLECKQALVDCEWDMDRAVDLLRVRRHNFREEPRSNQPIKPIGLTLTIREEGFSLGKLRGKENK